MKFENAFVVNAAVREVWATLMDIERVAPCMPGAQVLERIDDDRYKLGIKIKVGPISMLYRGEVEVIERDEPARRAWMHAMANEVRGQGTANADLRITLAENQPGTHASIETELQVSGTVAAMGRSVIVDVAGKLADEFAANLAALIAQEPVLATARPDLAARPVTKPVRIAAAPPEQEPLQIGKLMASVAAGRLRDPRALLAATVTFAAILEAIRCAIKRAR